METLFIWRPSAYPHRLQESQIHLHSEGIEYKTETMARADDGLWYGSTVSSLQVDVVPDALSRKPETYMMLEFTQQKGLLKKMMRLDLMTIRKTSASGQLMAFQVQPTLMEEIKATQDKDPRLQKFRKQVEAGLRTDVCIHSDGALYFNNRICVLKRRFDRRF